jgi:hypothetical protein
MDKGEGAKYESSFLNIVLVTLAIWYRGRPKRKMKKLPGTTKLIAVEVAGRNAPILPLGLPFFLPADACTRAAALPCDVRHP